VRLTRLGLASKGVGMANKSTRPSFLCPGKPKKEEGKLREKTNWNHETSCKGGEALYHA